MKAMFHLVILCVLQLAGVAQAVTCVGNIPAGNPDVIYTDHGNGTVTDSRTGLMWKKCSEGQTGHDCSGNSVTTFTWAEALVHAEAHTFAGHDDWRLPNIRELDSLVEECRFTPAINDAHFPNTPSSYFWSGSPYANFSSYTRVVYFFNGNSGGSNREDSLHVRLVRGGQSSASFNNVALRTLRVTRSGKGTVVLTTTGRACSGDCIGNSNSSHPVANSLADQLGLADLRKGAGTIGAREASAGLDCGSGCQVKYVAGTLTRLDARPSVGQVLSHWSGACVGMAPCLVTLDVDKAVTAHFIPIPAKPAAPAKPVASDGTQTDRVEVVWSAVSRATRYQVFRCVDVGLNLCGTMLAETEVDRHHDPSAQPGREYFYRVKACNAGGCSGFSPADTGWLGLQAPGWLTATEAQSSSVDLNWIAPTEVAGMALDYRVFRADNESGPWARLNAGTLVQLPRFLDTTARNGRRYWYQVQACSAGTSRCSRMSYAVMGQARSQGHALKAGAQMQPMLAELSSTHAGPELVTSRLEEMAGGIRFAFHIHAPNGPYRVNTLPLLTTTPLLLQKPVCGGGTVVREQEAWRLLSQGAHLVAGVHYHLDCGDGNPVEHSFVYLANATTGTARLLDYPGWRLAGMNLTADWNASGGGQDLMLSLESPSVTQIDLLDFSVREIYGSISGVRPMDLN